MAQEEVVIDYKEEVQRLRNALHAAISGIVVIDLQRKVQFVNTLWSMMHGFSHPDELIGKDFSLFSQEKSFQEHTIPLIETVTREGKGFAEMVHKRADGSTFPLYLRLILSRDKHNEVIGFVGSGLDMSEQKKRELELEKRNKELAELNETMTGRELRMIALKKEINELCGQFGEKPRYLMHEEEHST